MFDSFLKYQSLVAARFKDLQATYGFTIVNGNKSPDDVNLELRTKIERLLESN